MKIGMIAPPWAPIPPEGYGGIERVINYLTQGLAEAGHEVILYTIGQSKTRVLQKWIFAEPQEMGRLQAATAQLAFAYKDAIRIGVDVVHCHTWGEGAVVGAFSPLPVLHTVHSPMTEEMRRIYYPIRHDIGFAAISNFQRERMPSLNWVGTPYNPFDIRDAIYSTARGDYLLFLGRIAKDKGVHTACELAKRTGQQLMIAGAPNVYTEIGYFEKEIMPYFDLPNITYLGEVTGRKKLKLIAGAKALLFPIQWQEPFGMVLVEANAAGVPILAFRDGSVPELVRDGVNGFISQDLDGMISDLDRLDQISPQACRKWVEDNFSIEKVTARYLDCYRTVIAQKAATTLKESTFFERLTDHRPD